jgi:hypothetical protein
MNGRLGMREWELEDSLGQKNARALARAKARIRELEDQLVRATETIADLVRQQVSAALPR